MIAEPVADQRTAAEVGRRARLELVFAVRGGRTVLAHGYAEPPLRVGRMFPDRNGLHMILAGSAPGIFGGDRFEQTVRVERGARVRLTSQSALQVHPATQAGAARLVSKYHVADGASLDCYWDAMIPFARAIVEQQITVQLDADARLHWSDALMAGRAFSRRSLKDPAASTGERWAFSSLAHELRITRDDCLEYLERYRIVPAMQNLHQRWIGGEASYFATALVSGTNVTPDDVEPLDVELNRCDGLSAAVDRLSRQLVVARLAGLRGVPFHAARERLRAIARPLTAG